MNWCWHAGRILLAGVFLSAGWAKGSEIQNFAEDLIHYGLFSDATAGVIAMTFPGIELTVGALLLLHRFTDAALFAAGLMSAIFSMVLFWVVLSGIELKCGCFGDFWEVTPAMGLIRALFLLGLSIILWARLKEKKRGQTDGLTSLVY